MTLRQKRMVALVVVFTAGGFFVWMGLDGWTIDALPAHYLGYIVLGIGAAGLLGANIWYGGPLDLRHDSEQSDKPQSPPKQ